MRMKVTTKLLVMALIGAALTMAVGVAGWWGVSSVADATARMMKNEAQIAQHSARVRANTLGLRRFEKDIFINIQDAQKVDEYVGKFNGQQANLGKRLEALASVAVLPEDRERVARMTADLKAYGAGMAAIIAKIKAGEITTAQDGNKAVGEHKDVIHRLEKTAEDFATEGNQRMDAIERTLAGTARSAVWAMSILAAVAVVVGFALSRLTARSITVPLRHVADGLHAVAERDFTRQVEVRSRDELGRMAEAFNEAVREMREALLEVSGAAQHTSAASDQLSGASQQISSGAQEQASALEETAASLEEITSTVKQNADNARQANQLALGSREVAEKGGQVVADAVTSMNAINEASKKIADIILTIDEIAFQTNLLALNAAVEAARAGEQGRGFAVVAAEVRNLAQRSASAAKEIKTLIKDSVQKVEAGSELVNRSGATLGEIVTAVKRVTDIIGEIAAASQEQSTGIDQVNRAVAQMDQATQSNAAQTEEVSSTAETLSSDARRLQALVSRFKLGHGPAPAAAGAGRATAPAAPKAAAPSLVKALAARVKAVPAPSPAVAPHGHGHANGNGHVNGSARAKEDDFEEF